MTKTALITGAAKRIGRVIAVDLAQHGWDIVIHYRRSESEAQEVAATIRDLGRTAAAVQADLADELETSTLIDRAAQAIGAPLTCLVHNASAYENDNVPEGSRAVWNRLMAVNAHAPHVLSQSFAAQLPENSRGDIIHILDASIAGPVRPDFVAYGASRHAQWGVVKMTAAALAARNIRVNAVAPGPTLRSPYEPEAYFARAIARTPRGAATQLEEITDATRLFLDGENLSGRIIILNGSSLPESVPFPLHQGKNFSQGTIPCLTHS